MKKFLSNSSEFSLQFGRKKTCLIAFNEILLSILQTILAFNTATCEPFSKGSTSEAFEQI